MTVITDNRIAERRTQISIPSVPIALGTYCSGYMGCLGAYEQPNVRIAGSVGYTGRGFY
jgi:hypothetical protein